MFFQPAVLPAGKAEYRAAAVHGRQRQPAVFQLGGASAALGGVAHHGAVQGYLRRVDLRQLSLFHPADHARLIDAVGLHIRYGGIQLSPEHKQVSRRHPVGRIQRLILPGLRVKAVDPPAEGDAGPGLTARVIDPVPVRADLARVEKRAGQLPDPPVRLRADQEKAFSLPVGKAGAVEPVRHLVQHLIVLFFLQLLLQRLSLFLGKLPGIRMQLVRHADGRKGARVQLFQAQERKGQRQEGGRLAPADIQREKLRHALRRVRRAFPDQQRILILPQHRRRVGVPGHAPGLPVPPQIHVRAGAVLFQILPGHLEGQRFPVRAVHQ